MKNIVLPDFGYLRTQFEYEENTGKLLHRNSSQEAGWIVDGGSTNYRLVTVQYASQKPKKVFVHRIIWKLMTGEEPPEQVDHIDGNGLNNAWTNIRDGSGNTNNTNRKMRKDNTSGFNGIYFKKNRWVAYVSSSGKTTYLGRFKEPHFAGEAARLERERRGYTERHGK